MFVIKGIIEYGIVVNGGMEEIVAEEEGILRKEQQFMWIVNLNDDIRDDFALYPIVHYITNTLTFIIVFRIADFFL